MVIRPVKIQPRRDSWAIGFGIWIPASQRGALGELQAWAQEPGPDRTSHFKTKWFPQSERPERPEYAEWRGILTDRELLNRG